MNLTCKGCGNDNAYQLRVYMDRGESQEICDQCSSLRPAEAAIPDVYLGTNGQKFQNLCDKMGRPYEITSKRQKKEVMDRLGVKEAGDRVNGAPYGSKNWIEGTRDYRKRQFEKDRPMIRETLRQWREKHA